MDDIQIFNSKEFGEVRALGQKGRRVVAVILLCPGDTICGIASRIETLRETIKTMDDAATRLEEKENQEV